ncbi:transposase [Streptomyces sp. NPDC127051]|uniref:transposase n=1 Tax=Streptomyces sp. NPDC127051 TaxID=3347119 RepID=UPI00364E56C3
MPQYPSLGRIAPDASLHALVKGTCPLTVALQRKIRRHYEAIRAALTTGMSNRLVESTNTKTRLIIRRGFGFHSADAAIALVVLVVALPYGVAVGRRPLPEHVVGAPGGFAVLESCPLAAGQVPSDRPVQCGERRRGRRARVFGCLL